MFKPGDIVIDAYKYSNLGIGIVVPLPEGRSEYSLHYYTFVRFFNSPYKSITTEEKKYHICTSKWLRLASPLEEVLA